MQLWVGSRESEGARSRMRVIHRRNRKKRIREKGLQIGHMVFLKIPRELELRRMKIQMISVVKLLRGKRVEEFQEKRGAQKGGRNGWENDVGLWNEADERSAFPFDLWNKWRLWKKVSLVEESNQPG